MSIDKGKFKAFVGENDIDLQGNDGEYFICVHHWILDDLMKAISIGFYPVEAFIFDTYLSIPISDHLENAGIEIAEIWEGTP